MGREISAPDFRKVYYKERDNATSVVAVARSHSVAKGKKKFEFLLHSALFFLNALGPSTVPFIEKIGAVL